MSDAVLVVAREAHAEQSVLRKRRVSCAQLGEGDSLPPRQGIVSRSRCRAWVGGLCSRTGQLCRVSPDGPPRAGQVDGHGSLVGCRRLVCQTVGSLVPADASMARHALHGDGHTSVSQLQQQAPHVRGELQGLAVRSPPQQLEPRPGVGQAADAEGLLKLRRLESRHQGQRLPHGHELGPETATHCSSRGAGLHPPVQPLQVDLGASPTVLVYLLPVVV